jgi:uridine phosphorylase
MTDHLRPTAPIAPAAVLPGDPGRALALAQDLLEAPRMANHARGLWGYTAATPAGELLTVQSTGIGGPSVAIVLEELAGLGVKRAVRLGTCRALDESLGPGALVVAETAIPLGASGAGVGAEVGPDPELTAALLADGHGAIGATVASTDLYYDPEAEARWHAALRGGARALDLGTVAALMVGERLGVAVASALVVSRSAAGESLSDEEVERASLGLGRAASAALGVS